MLEKVLLYTRREILDRIRMIHLYKWYNSEEELYVIAVGIDSIFARCYKVRDGYVIPLKPTLGQFLKFNAVDEDSFKGPIHTTMEDIRKQYGPVMTKTPYHLIRMGFNPILMPIPIPTSMPENDLPETIEQTYNDLYRKIYGNRDEYTVQ